MLMGVSIELVANVVGQEWDERVIRQSLNVGLTRRETGSSKRRRSADGSAQRTQHFKIGFYTEPRRDDIEFRTLEPISYGTI
jgi:hypothetical protein